MLSIVALLIIFLALPDPASSGDAAGTLGRLTFITPRKGHERALDEGYRRHLQWHAKAQDPWTWHGWKIVTGDRIGTLVDATLDHAAADFDHPVDPAGDHADNMKNTMPHAAAVESFFIRRREDLGGKGALIESSLLQLWDVRVELDGIEAFERELRASAATTRTRNLTWYEMVSGGEQGRYLLLASVARPSALDLATCDPLPRSLYPEIPESSRRALARSVRSVRSELLRYQPDLSYVPDEETDGRADRAPERPGRLGSMAIRR